MCDVCARDWDMSRPLRRIYGVSVMCDDDDDIEYRFDFVSLDFAGKQCILVDQLY